jgi:acid phosphatase family membrane protein YuiD
MVVIANVLQILTSNYVINGGVLSWFLAQFLKVPITFLTTRKLQLGRLLSTGGMPSSHSAVSSAVVVCVGRLTGFSSPEFGIALLLAAIVIHDAIGIRRAAGEHAKIINLILFDIDAPCIRRAVEEQTDKPVKFPQKRLKEHLGHNSIEVLTGCLLGTVVALIIIPNETCLLL